MMRLQNSRRKKNTRLTLPNFGPAYMYLSKYTYCVLVNMKKGILIFYNNLPFLKLKLLKCSALALDSVLSNDCVPGILISGKILKRQVNLAQKKV